MGRRVTWRTTGVGTKLTNYDMFKGNDPKAEKTDDDACWPKHQLLKMCDDEKSTVEDVRWWKINTVHEVWWWKTLLMMMYDDDNNQQCWRIMMSHQTAHRVQWRQIGTVDDWRKTITHPNCRYMIVRTNQHCGWSMHDGDTVSTLLMIMYVRWWQTPNCLCCTIMTNPQNSVSSDPL